MTAHATLLELEIARAARARGARLRFRFRVAGQSMRPHLLPGMRVVVETVRLEELAPGELVCWHRRGARAGHTVVHRLVRVETDGGAVTAIVTRGDAQPYDDGPVRPEEVIGRVVGAFPPGAWYRLRCMARALARALFRVTSLAAAPVARRVVRPGLRARAVAEAEGAVRAEASIWGFDAGRGYLVRRLGWGALAWELSSVETNRWARNLGVGTTLVRTLLKEAARAGAARVALLVFPDNRPAIRVYRRVGFARSVDRALEQRATACDPRGRRRILMERPTACAPPPSCGRSAGP
jgi:signal peptidase I